MRWILASFAAAILFAGSAEAAERKLLMAGFKDLLIQDDIEVDLTVGKAPRAVVTGEKRELSRVILERRGAKLVIRLRSKINNAPQRTGGEPLKLTISNYDLENVEIRGNGLLTASALENSGKAKILVVGSGNVNIDHIDADRLVATVVGNGRVTLGGGKVRSGLVEIQGSAEIDASAVAFRDLSITHDGNGSSSANVANAATITNNGRGAISISGKGRCFIRQAGAATIDCPKYGR